MPASMSPDIFKRICKAQRDEITGSLIYEAIAARQKDERNRAALLELAEAEARHYEIWKTYTGKDIPPTRSKVLFYNLLTRIFGDTFAFKFMERGESFTVGEMRAMAGEIPEAGLILAQEEEHETRLMGMVDEERLHYVGSIVLGLNDALVELTGALAGLSFALANTRLVALSGIITGVSATLSMAASNYLAQRAEGNAKAFKSSLYTGIAYLITVALLVTPYLLLPNSLYLAALGIMLATVVLIILGFNYYISVAKSHPLWRHFAEMTAISLGVAAISFLIGLGAKAVLGIEV